MPHLCIHCGAGFPEKKVLFPWASWWHGLLTVAEQGCARGVWQGYSRSYQQAQMAGAELTRMTPSDQVDQGRYADKNKFGFRLHRAR
jgi:hypothetical protein